MKIVIGGDFISTKSNQPFFSIIVPVYNVESYLPICLESVLGQGVQDYEIILVDDSSKDSSGQICDDYHAKYPEKIKVVHQTNQGPDAARKAGVKLAQGRYACFLDSDDRWASNLLNRLYETIQSTDADVLFFGWKRIDETGADLNRPSPVLFSKKGFIEKNEVFERLLSTALFNPLWLKCIRRDLFVEGDEFVSEHRIQNGEDLMMSLPPMYRAKTFYYLDEALYEYRVNTMSITHTYRKGQHKNLDVVRPALFQCIVKLGLDSQKNRMTFFKMYLDLVWTNIVRAYRGIENLPERDAVLDEIYAYEYVRQAKAYLKKVNMPFFKRWGLSIFYTGSRSQLNVFMRGYSAVQTIKQTILPFK